MKNGLLRQPLIQPETQCELVTFDTVGSELEQVRLSLSYMTSGVHIKKNRTVAVLCGPPPVA